MSEMGWTGNPFRQFCSFVGRKKQFFTFSSLVLQLSMFGVVLPNLLVLSPDLGISLNSFGGFLGMFLPVGMFKFLV
jgi:hypothetical protein